MPNSTAAQRTALLDAIGVPDAEPLFGQIPPAHRLRTPLALPPALASEIELTRHLDGLIARNRPAGKMLSFLGAGCWQHHVPAVVDEIVTRSEFLTPVWGTPSSDFGRNQAWFEFTSQLGALLDLDLVGLPVYSWGCAAGHALRMAARLNGRRRVLVPALLCPERRAVIDSYCASATEQHAILIDTYPCDRLGRADIDALKALAGPDIAAIYFENPAFLGGLEHRAADIVDIAHAAGAEAVVGVDPISLGVVAPPGAYGADIAVGTIQTLGIHMHAGGGLGGFIASRDEDRYAAEYPTLLNSITEAVDGSLQFGLMRFHQSSYGSREEGKDWTGNSTYLWAIGASVYMALLGPAGFREVGELILARSHAAAERLARVPGLSVAATGGFFKEFTVTFDRVPVEAVDRALRGAGILGGLPLTGALPGMGNSALYAFTEVHDHAAIERLATTLEELLA
ncbi:aminomethyl-transferring glycine dehydrogenase subunit GcvPA [Sphingomonas changnyeongensis]|uniref:Aminomethyl-transferring glycine dehydrogenase subunit GcvPA n=1 Tax=Sphingomonas changnyeongensis TaxID=2698679 RepID=A0A7Z2NY69_9SPHN|nr:aminomethyl-transferring glycine dehydrogenase subunit GcvPA [Sphingomonas changnyeongensis]QHL91601.1 aminomethyl-transferring glycine dehydrogenase subunit GcvPA [Sphingomonas changnyeongensis]